MPSGDTINPGLPPGDFIPARRLPRSPLLWISLAALIIMIAASFNFVRTAQRDVELARKTAAPAGSAPSPADALLDDALPFSPLNLSTSDPRALEALSPEEAIAANAARPPSTAPNPAARPLSIPLTDLASFDRSIDCMTAAIYYEAASETVDGQRAVAQVVLNRLRHRLYPHTVCGVVFQGAERATGCQFSFTCDGSLTRVPSLAGWTRARNIALQALEGYVFKPVGLSTHYHADYVVPFWASSLVKLTTIGRHIFYRIDGGYGSPRAFDALYAGNEPQAFTREASGVLVLLNADGLPLPPVDPAAPVAGAAVPTNARAILDANGHILAGANQKPGAAFVQPGAGTTLAGQIGAGKPLAGQPAIQPLAAKVGSGALPGRNPPPPASAPKPAAKATQRTVLGIDGGAAIERDVRLKAETVM